LSHGCPVALLRVIKRGDTYKPERPLVTTMQVFAVDGTDAAAGLDRVLPALDGRVGVVRADGARPAGDGGTTALARADTRYDLEDGWRAAGAALSLRAALERLAPDHDYAAVLGSTDLEVPRIVVGGPNVDDAAIHADAAASLDVEAAVAAIEAAEPFETLASLVAAVKRSASADRAGAIATFTGRVREKDAPDDERTRYLEFEKYAGVADRTMRSIETTLEDREGVFDVRLHHRTGRVDAGEDIVFVVVLAGHRREAFRTVEDGIDRLKDEVPLFKKEVTGAETFWVHDRE
jgi:molybdopterin synthase catalytic subunit